MQREQSAKARTLTGRREATLPNQTISDRIIPFASASLALFAAACSGDTIDLGEKSSNLEAAPSSCPAEGAVLVTNQPELDALAGCEVLDQLFIGPFVGADLSPLSELREVRGTLEIGSLTAAFNGADPGDLPIEETAQLLQQRWLFSLAGLEGLERVGNLGIAGFDVDDLAALSNLELLTAEGSLGLSSCSGFRDLSGLERVAGLQSIELNCDDLESLEGLRFPSVFSNLLLTGPQLKDLGDLSASVINAVTLFNTGLENVDGLALLQNANSVDISDNANLVDLSGLDMLGSVQFLNISGNSALEQLPAFQRVTTLGTLLVTNNPELRNFPQFPNVQLNFEGFAELDIALSARDLLIFRPNVIEVRDNASLESVALPEGFQAAGLISIQENPALRSLAISSIKAIDLLDIADNAVLDSVDLGDLATVDTLRVVNNPELDLTLFDGVRTFASELSVGPAQ
jgi:hypothetical protein